MLDDPFWMRVRLDEVNRTRFSYAEILDHVADDLSEALDLLPAVEIWPRKHAERISDLLGPATVRVIRDVAALLEEEARNAA